MTIRPLAELEREAIIQALDAYRSAPRGAITAAAAALKISPKTLYVRIHTYGLAARYLTRRSPHQEETS